jgi:hypothetical protein
LLDIELAFPVAFILLEAAGLVYAALATYLYFRFERSAADMHVPVAISALAMHYVLAFASRYVRGEVLLPSLLLFLMALTPALGIWLGSKTRSKAGIRIALAGFFTLVAFVCGAGHDIYLSTKFGWR